MRFLIPAQTIAEYRHQQMPVYETLAAIGAGIGSVGAAALPVLGSIGSTALQALPSVASAAPSIISALGIGGHKAQSSVPTFNPLQTLQFQQQEYNQMYPEALDFGRRAYDQASAEGIDFAKRGTKADIANQNLVTPGSSAQRQLAQNQINQYIQGNVPTDVQQNINRQVAQNLGGGFNLYSQGGQAPQNFARNIGQTSLGLSQFGLSAAPTWQQLANSMVVRPEVGLSAGLQGISLGNQLTGMGALYGNDLGISNYQGLLNQYQGGTTQNQGQTQMLQGLGGAANSILGSFSKSDFFKNLLPSAQGAAVTLGGLPSASTAGSYMSDLGYKPTSFTALQNTGGGTAYPFGGG